MKKDGVCTVKHPTEAQKVEAGRLVEEAKAENQAREAREARSLFEAAQRSGIAR